MCPYEHKETKLVWQDDFSGLLRLAQSFGSLVRGGRSLPVTGSVSGATVAWKICLDPSCHFMLTDSEGQGRTGTLGMAGL